MNTIWNQRIPTLLAIFLIVIGIGVTTYVLQQTTNLFGHAAPSEEPQDVRITNITDTSFTVSYKTDATVIGTLSVGSSNVQTVFDDRDEASGVPKAYNLHSFTVSHLTPKTSYQFSILSGTTTYLNNDNPFEVTTFPALEGNPSGQIPLAGKILEPDGTAPQEALLYVSMNNGQVLSTLIKPNGLYVLPLNVIRTKNGDAYETLQADDKLQILVTDGNNTSQAIVLVSGINPVPAITLTQNYDFTIGTTPLASSAGQKSILPEFPLDTTLQATPKILTPNKDNASFTDQQPVFQGTGQPNETVKIEIHSDAAITTEVTTNGSGKWSYRPTKPLSPGEHTITIITADASGILHTIQRSFTVYAAGSQVNQTATPSATPTIKVPTATPTPKATATPTPLPTAKVTQVSTPTPTMLIPTPTKQILPTGKIPVTGSDSTPLIAGAGILTTIVGIILFVLARGAAL